MIIEAVEKIIEAVRMFVEAVRVLVEAIRVLQSLANKSIPINQTHNFSSIYESFYPIKIKI